ncbi:unannotated protein [freshwater metagenome]|uniref:Unannotated protein n=1 Tax=freshwater metagenome TaxID=449393 RepID=A0A6J7EML1_9ZZZZ
MRMLVENLDAHVLQGRQDARQRHGRAHTNDLEPHAPGFVESARVPVQRQLARLQSFDGQRIGNAGLRAELLLVPLGKGVGVGREEAGGLRFADRGHHSRREGVLPALGRLSEPGLKGDKVNVRYRHPLGQVHDIVKPREHRLGHQGRVVDRDAPERLAEQPLHAETHARRVAIARQVHEA